MTKALVFQQKDEIICCSGAENKDSTWFNEVSALCKVFDHIFIFIYFFYFQKLTLQGNPLVFRRSTYIKIKLGNNNDIIRHLSFGHTHNIVHEVSQKTTSIYN